MDIKIIYYTSIPGLDVPRRKGRKEQLWLKNGVDIGCFLTEFNGVEINTEQDIPPWNYK